MPFSLALLLDGESSVLERIRDLLAQAGTDVVAVATPDEALALLGERPAAVVLAILEGDRAPEKRRFLDALVGARLSGRGGSGAETILGRSEESERLRDRLQELAASQLPVLFTGEPGSGRAHAARCLNALASPAEPFVVVDAAERAETLANRLRNSPGTVFVASIEGVAWPAQQAFATTVASGRSRARLMASTSVDPGVAAEEGRLVPELLAVFGDAIVRVAPLRERPSDIAVLVRRFVEELRRLNGLPPITLAPEALAALESHGWPDNVRQLRNAVETAVILAGDGTVRLKDLPEYLHGGVGPADPGIRGDRRFREAKRSIVEAFERSYLKDLLNRHGGNVTGAAEHAGMLRSALQRLLRKHDLRSADFRGTESPRFFAS